MPYQFLKFVFVAFMLTTITACSGLLSKQPLQTTFYALESAPSFEKQSGVSNNQNAMPTLIISTPKAAAGFDTRRMMYTRNAHQLEYFAKNEWIDTPANMLQPLLVSVIENTHDFNAVLPKHGLVNSNLRLESEIVKLIQIFNSKPSYVQFVLRTTIIDNLTNKIIAHREFDESVDAKSDDPLGGVLAANQAVNLVLEKLSQFSHEAVISWQVP